MLVKNCKTVGKLCNFWESDVYVVVATRGELPVYELQKYLSPRSRVRTLHRNLLKCVNETVPPQELSAATTRDSHPKKAPTPARNTPRVVVTPDRASAHVAARLPPTDSISVVHEENENSSSDEDDGCYAVCVSGPSGPPAHHVVPVDVDVESSIEGDEPVVAQSDDTEQLSDVEVEEPIEIDELNDSNELNAVIEELSETEEQIDTNELNVSEELSATEEHTQVEMLSEEPDLHGNDGEGQVDLEDDAVESDDTDTGTLPGSSGASYTSAAEGLTHEDSSDNDESSVASYHTTEAEWEPPSSDSSFDGSSDSPPPVRPVCRRSARDIKPPSVFTYDRIGEPSSRPR